MRKEAFLLLFLLATIPPVHAQLEDVGKTISDILVPFSGVIFIIAFVIILLLVGGVFPKVSVGGIPWGTIALLIAIALIFIIPQFVPEEYFPRYLEVPENFKVYPIPSYAVDVFAMLGLPREWVSHVPAIIYMVILPFAGIFALIWAFLASLNIFPSNVNRILALVITFITIPVGWFMKMFYVLFSFMGAWAIAVFAVTFIAGVFYRGAAVVQKERLEFKKYVGKTKQLYKEVEGELKELEDAPLPQMTSGVNRILESYGSQLPAGATRALGQVLQAKRAEDGAEEIRKALEYIRKAYR